MRVRILVAIAALSVLFGAAGFALGAGGTPTFAKACINSAGSLRLVSNGSCGTGKTINVVTRAYAGVAKGYAYIIEGEVDPAYSWNVTQSNLYSDDNGSYCFRNLPFSPKHAQATLSYWGPANGDIPVITLNLPPNPNSDCGLDALPQAYVFTGFVEEGVFTDGVELAFYIVFF